MADAWSWSIAGMQLSIAKSILLYLVLQSSVLLEIRALTEWPRIMSLTTETFVFINGSSLQSPVTWGWCGPSPHCVYLFFSLLKWLVHLKTQPHCSKSACISFFCETQSKNDSAVFVHTMKVSLVQNNILKSHMFSNDKRVNKWW